MSQQQYILTRILLHLLSVLLAFMLRRSRKLPLSPSATNNDWSRYGLLFIRTITLVFIIWTIADYILLQSMLHCYFRGLYTDYIIYGILFFLLDIAFIGFRFPPEAPRGILSRNKPYAVPGTRLSLVWLSQTYRVCRYIYASLLAFRLLSVILIPLDFPAEGARRQPDKTVFGRYRVNLIIHANESIDEHLLRFYYLGKPNTADLVVYEDFLFVFKRKILTIKEVPFFHLEDPYEPGVTAYIPSRLDLLRFSGRLPQSPDTATFWKTADDLLLVARTRGRDRYLLMLAHKNGSPTSADTITADLRHTKEAVIHYNRGG